MSRVLCANFTLPAGSYKLWYYVKGDANHNDVDVCASAVECSIAKIDPTITTNPKAISGLEYKNEDQTLAMGGEWTGDGTMKYMISETKPEKSSWEWADKVPARKNAGKYNLWYYISEGINYNETDVCNEPILCEIAKSSKGVSITLDSCSGSCYIGSDVDFSATPVGFSEETPDVTATSKPEEIATVSKKSSTPASSTFSVTGVRKGKTSIEVFAESANYKISASYSINVQLMLVSRMLV